MKKKFAALLSITTLLIGLNTASLASHEHYWIYLGTKTNQGLVEACNTTELCDIKFELTDRIHICETCSTKKYETIKIRTYHSVPGCPDDLPDFPG